MINVSTDFRDEILKLHRSKSFQIQAEVYWSDALGWTDETARLVGFTSNQSMGYEFSELFPSADRTTGTVTFRNSSFRYSTERSGGDSTIRSAIDGFQGAYRKPIRLTYIIDGDECLLFTGYIRSSVPTINTENKTATFELWDITLPLFQRRISTPVAADYYHDDLIEFWASSYGGLSNFDLSNSAHRVPVAWMDDEPLQRELHNIAAACGSLLFTDVVGNLKMRPLNVLSSSQDPTDLRSVGFQSISKPQDVNSSASKIIISYSGRRASGIDEVYRLHKQEIVYPGESKTITARFSSPISFPILLEPDTHYRFESYGGIPMNYWCVITPTFYAQQAKIVISNTHPWLTARLTYLNILGQVLSGRDSEEYELETNVGDYDDEDRVLSFRDNQYIQDRNTAAYLAEMLKEWAGSGYRIWQVGGVHGIPQLELGDWVSFYDNREVSSSNVVSGFVVGINTNTVIPLDSVIDKPVFNQILTVIQPYGFASNYFRIGTDIFGSSRVYAP